MGAKALPSHVQDVLLENLATSGTSWASRAGEEAEEQLCFPAAILRMQLGPGSCTALPGSAQPHCPGATQGTIICNFTPAQNAPAPRVAQDLSKRDKKWLV